MRLGLEVFYWSFFIAYLNNIIEERTQLLKNCILHKILRQKQTKIKSVYIIFTWYITVHNVFKFYIIKSLLR
jgi:hypothetical protein